MAFRYLLSILKKIWRFFSNATHYLPWHPTVPDDLIQGQGKYDLVQYDSTFEILKYLPVKTLLRLKCASKGWKSIIESPDFILSHFKQAKTQILMVSFNREDSMDPTPLLQVFSCENQVFTSKIIQFPVEENKRILIVGSVRGLICVTCPPYLNIYIWNPATREFKIIPISYSKEEDSRFAFGFGLDLNTNCYKVVRIHKTVDDANYLFVAYDTMVYAFNTTSSSWSWRRIDVCPARPHSDSPLFLNGNLFWSALIIVDRVLLSFDTTTEKFMVTPFPETRANRTCGATLTVFDQSPAIMILDYEYNYELWVLRQYGVKESWEPLLTVETGLSFDSFGLFNNDWLLSSTSLILYNPRSLERITIESEYRAMGRTRSQVILYEESLFGVN